MRIKNLARPIVVVTVSLLSVFVMAVGTLYAKEPESILVTKHGEDVGDKSYKDLVRSSVITIKKSEFFNNAKKVSGFRAYSPKSLDANGKFVYGNAVNNIELNGLAREVLDGNGKKVRARTFDFVDNAPDYMALVWNGNDGWVLKAAQQQPYKIKIVSKLNSGESSNFKEISSTHYQFNLSSYPNGFTILDESGNYIVEEKDKGGGRVGLANYNPYSFQRWRYKSADWNKNYYICQYRTNGGDVDVLWNSETGRWEIYMDDPGIKVRDMEGNRDINLEYVSNCVYRFDLRDVKGPWYTTNGFTLLDYANNLIVEGVRDTETQREMGNRGMPITTCNLANGSKFSYNFEQERWWQDANGGWHNDKVAFDLDSLNTKNYWGGVSNVVREHYLYLRWNGGTWQMTFENETAAGYDENGEPVLASIYLRSISPDDHDNGMILTDAPVVMNPQVSCSVGIYLEADAFSIPEDAGTTPAFNSEIVNRYHWYKSTDNVHWMHIYQKSRYLETGIVPSDLGSHGLSDGYAYYRVQFHETADPNSPVLYTSNSVYVYSDDLYVHNYWQDNGIPVKNDSRLPIKTDCGSISECYTYKLDLAKWKYPGKWWKKQKWNNGFGITNHDDWFQKMDLDCSLHRYLDDSDDWWYFTKNDSIPDELFVYIYSEAPERKSVVRNQGLSNEYREYVWEYKWKMSLENPCGKLKFDINGDGVGCWSSIVMTATSEGATHRDYQWYRSANSNTTKSWIAMPEKITVKDENGEDVDIPLGAKTDKLTLGYNKNYSYSSTVDWSDYAEKYYMVVATNNATGKRDTSTVKFLPSTQLSIQDTLSGKSETLFSPCCDVYRIELNKWHDNGFSFNELNCNPVRPIVDSVDYISTSTTDNDYKVSSTNVTCDDKYGYVYRDTADGKWHLTTDNNVCGCLKVASCGEVGKVVGRVCGYNNNTYQKIELKRPEVDVCEDMRTRDYFVTYDVEELSTKGKPESERKEAKTETLANGDTLHYMLIRSDGGNDGDFELKWTVRVWKNDCHGIRQVWAMDSIRCKGNIIAPMDSISSDDQYNLCASTNKAFSAVEYSACSNRLGSANVSHKPYIFLEWFVQYVSDGMKMGDTNDNWINKVGSGAKAHKDYPETMQRVTINFAENLIYKEGEYDYQGVYAVGCFQYVKETVNGVETKRYLNAGEPIYTFVNVVVEPDATYQLWSLKDNAPISGGITWCKREKNKEISLKVKDRRSHCVRNYGAASMRTDMPKQVTDVINVDANNLKYEIRYTAADTLFMNTFSVSFDNDANKGNTNLHFAPANELYQPGMDPKLIDTDGLYMVKEDASCEDGTDGVIFSIANNLPLCDGFSRKEMTIDSLVAQFYFKGNGAKAIKPNTNCSSSVTLANGITFEDNDFTIDCNATNVNDVILIPVGDNTVTVRAENPMVMSGACDTNPDLTIKMNNGGTYTGISGYADLEKGRGTYTFRLGETLVKYHVEDGCGKKADCEHTFVVMNKLDFDCGDASKNGVRACLDGEIEVSIDVPLPEIVGNTNTQIGGKPIDYVYEMASAVTDGNDISDKVSSTGKNTFVIRLKSRTEVVFTWNVSIVGFKKQTLQSVTCPIEFKPIDGMPNSTMEGNAKICEVDAKFSAKYAGQEYLWYYASPKVSADTLSTEREVTIPYSAVLKDQTKDIVLQTVKNGCMTRDTVTAEFYAKPTFDLKDLSDNESQCPVDTSVYFVHIENVNAHNDFSVEWSNGATTWIDNNKVVDTVATITKLEKDCGDTYAYRVTVTDNVSTCVAVKDDSFTVKTSALAFSKKPKEEEPIDVEGKECVFRVPDLSGLIEFTDNCGTVAVTYEPPFDTEFEDFTTVKVTATDLCNEPLEGYINLIKSTSDILLGDPAFDVVDATCKEGGRININARSKSGKTLVFELRDALDNLKDHVEGMDSVFANLSGGTYFSRVVDPNGCDYKDIIVVEGTDDKLKLEIDSANSQLSSCDESSAMGKVSFVITDGTAPYNVSLIKLVSKEIEGKDTIVRDTISKQIITTKVNGEYAGVFDNIGNGDYLLGLDDAKGCKPTEGDKPLKIEIGDITINFDCDKLGDEKVALDEDCAVEYTIPLDKVADAISFVENPCFSAVGIAYNIKGDDNFVENGEPKYVLVEEGAEAKIKLTGHNLKRPVVVNWLVFPYDASDKTTLPFTSKKTDPKYNVVNANGDKIGDNTEHWYAKMCMQNFYATDGQEGFNIVGADKVPSDTTRYSVSEDLCSAKYEREAVAMKNKLGISRCTEVTFIIKDADGGVLEINGTKDWQTLEGTILIDTIYRGQYNIEYKIDGGVDETTGNDIVIERTQKLDVIDDIGPSQICIGEIRVPMDPDFCEVDTVITYSDYAKEYLVKSGVVTIETVNGKEVVKKNTSYDGGIVYETNTEATEIKSFTDECGDTLKVEYMDRSNGSTKVLAPDGEGIHITGSNGVATPETIYWTLVDPSGAKSQECESKVLATDTVLPVKDAEETIARLEAQGCQAYYEIISIEDLASRYNVSKCTDFNITYWSNVYPQRKTFRNSDNISFEYSDLGYVDVVTFSFESVKDPNVVYTTRVRINVVDEEAPRQICPDSVPVFLDDNCTYTMKLSPNRAIADLRADLVLTGNESYLGFDWEKNWNDVDETDKHAIKYDCDSLKVHIVNIDANNKKDTAVFNVADAKTLEFSKDASYTYTFLLSDVSLNKSAECKVTYFGKDALAPGNVKSKLDDEILYYKEGNCYGDTTLELKTVFKALKLDTTKLFDNCDGDDVTIHYTVKKNGADSIPAVTELKTGSPLYLKGVDSDVFDVLWRVRDKSNNDAKVPQKFIVKDSSAPAIDCDTAFRPITVEVKDVRVDIDTALLIKSGFNVKFTYKDECDDTTYLAKDAFEKAFEKWKQNGANTDTIYLVFEDKHSNQTVCPQVLKVIHCPVPVKYPFTCDSEIPEKPTTLEEFENAGGKIYFPKNLKEEFVVKDNVTGTMCNVDGQKITRNFKFYYTHGDSVECNSDYRVRDSIPPVWDAIQPKLDTMLSCADSVNAAKIIYPTATDNCSSVTVLLVETDNRQSIDPTLCEAYSYDIYYKFVVKDGCGNVSNDTVSFVEMRRDTTPPTYTLPDNFADTSAKPYPVYSVYERPCRFLMPNLGDLVTDRLDNCPQEVWVDQEPEAGTELFGDIVAKLIIHDACNGDTLYKKITVSKSSNIVQLEAPVDTSFCEGLTNDTRLDNIVTKKGTFYTFMYGEYIARQSIFCVDVYKNPTMLKTADGRDSLDCKDLFYYENPYTHPELFYWTSSKEYYFENPATHPDASPNYPPAGWHEKLDIQNATYTGAYTFVVMDTMTLCVDTISSFIHYYEPPRIAMNSDTVEACEFQTLPVNGASGDYATKYGVCVEGMGLPITDEGWLLDGVKYEGTESISYDSNGGGLVYYAENACGRTRSDSSRIWDCNYSYDDVLGEFTSDRTTQSMVKDSSSAILNLHVHQHLEGDGMLLTSPFTGKSRVWTGDPVDLQLVTHYNDNVEFVWYKVVGTSDALYNKFDAYGNIMEEYLDPNDDPDEKIGTSFASEYHTHYQTVASLTDTTLFYVVVTDNVCSSAASNVIKVDVCKEIPTAITPHNSVGLNDVFMEGFDVQIFDRYGHLLFQGENGWDGSINGDLADPAVYFYVVTMRDGSLAKGTVEVVYFR